MTVVKKREKLKMTPPKHHILVIDDDTRLRRLLYRYLTENGFEVSEASDATQADELFSLFIFDLLVMDVMMPQKNGVEFTKELRQRGIVTPILMLTAMGQADDRINGLESGADDYLCKPFEPKELLLRIHNLLKHHKQTGHTIDLISFGDCVYDIKRGLLTKNGHPVSLTTADQTLLRVLSAKSGEAVSREELGQILGTDNFRTIDVQITRLRKKIESPDQPACIQTVRGQGYTLIPS